jgi:hypothetical protein
MACLWFKSSGASAWRTLKRTALAIVPPEDLGSDTNAAAAR